jgi:hypothetical protein
VTDGALYFVAIRMGQVRLLVERWVPYGRAGADFRAVFFDQARRDGHGPRNRRSIIASHGGELLWQAPTEKLGRVNSLA